MRVAEGQAHGAGVECVGVSVDHASEAAAHRRTGGGQVAVVGLGHRRDRRARSQCLRRDRCGCWPLNGQRVVVIIQRKAAKGHRSAGVVSRHMRAVVGAHCSASNAHHVPDIRLAIAARASASCLARSQRRRAADNCGCGAVVDLASGHQQPAHRQRLGRNRGGIGCAGACRGVARYGNGVVVQVGCAGSN